MGGPGVTGVDLAAESGVPVPAATPVPTGVATTAAALVAGVARASSGWEGAEAAAAQAGALLDRAAPLAQLDAAAYSAAVERLSRPLTR